MIIEVRGSPDISAEDVSNSTELQDHYEREDKRQHASSASSSLDVMGMQHILSDSWRNSYNSGYQTMADDGIEAPCRVTPGAINTGNANSIVSSLLLKASGCMDGMYIGGVGSGLEQKIQKLRAEKEAGDMTKCSSSVHSDQDSPIDFSVKRRSSFSGSLTDDSQTSLCSPGNVTDYSAMSPTMDSESANHSSDASKRSTPSPRRFDHQKFISHQDVECSSGGAASSLLALGKFPGMSSNNVNNGSTNNAFSQMTAPSVFVDPLNKQNSRPFKAYPKEALQMPLGFFGIPGLTPAAVQKGMESGRISGMNSEDVVSLYNHQIKLLMDKQLSGEDGMASPPSLPSASNRNNILQNHHQQQHPNRDPSHHHTNSSSLAFQPSTTSTSPPLVTSDHPKPNHTPAVSFSAPATSGSLSGARVSSTSPFHHSSNHHSSNHHSSNSRKRPRSMRDDQKDAAYWERRRKNNDAAKRSRDARRAKEDEIAIRAALLEQENIKLRVEVATLKTETARLRCLLYN